MPAGRAMRNDGSTASVAANAGILLVLRIQEPGSELRVAVRAREIDYSPARAGPLFLRLASSTLRTLACWSVSRRRRDASACQRTQGGRAWQRTTDARAAALARGERGQGTVEYVALVALVALIMVGVIAAMKSTQFAEGQQLGSLILKKIAEAVTRCITEPATAGGLRAA